MGICYFSPPAKCFGVENVVKVGKFATTSTWYWARDNIYCPIGRGLQMGWGEDNKDGLFCKYQYTQRKFTLHLQGRWKNNFNGENSPMNSPSWRLKIKFSKNKITNTGEIKKSGFNRKTFLIFVTSKKKIHWNEDFLKQNTIKMIFFLFGRDDFCFRKNVFSSLRMNQKFLMIENKSESKISVSRKQKHILMSFLLVYNRKMNKFIQGSFNKPGEFFEKYKIIFFFQNFFH